MSTPVTPAAPSRLAAENKENPLLAPYTAPFEAPPFDRIRDEHFEPAFAQAIRQHEVEIEQIATATDAPTFENTIEALERSGALLRRVSVIFFNLTSAHTNSRLQALAKELAPKLAAHRDHLFLNEPLFARVKAVYRAKSPLSPDGNEGDKLIEETYRNFIRSGANLNTPKKETLRGINSELSVLTLRFGQNLLTESNAYELVITDPSHLAGLPASAISAAAETAKARDKAGQWVFTLSNPSVMAFLQYADHRELRREIWEAFQTCGNRGNAEDNNALLLRSANLRLQRAKLLGYPAHAHYVLEEAMAETPETVNRLLNDLWAPALAKAKTEADDIRAEIASRGDAFAPEPHDWRYYAEIIRRKRYALDAEELRPYFPLENVVQGAFEVAQRLFGLRFEKRANIPVYHPEVAVYEVSDRDGSHLGLFYADYFPRESKRSGAWMTSYLKQGTGASGERIAPIVSIVCNFTRPVEGKPALLTFSEATTLFHEFGHALHGLLSRVRYESLSGTAVPRDFVELPSQVMENWAGHRDVLKEYARHYETGEVIPDELITRLEAAHTYGGGFKTVEYLAASFLDMDYHTRTEVISESVADFERAAMERISLIGEIIPRYRSTYFQHIFAGGYSSGYYSYIWAEVLDADAFAAFESTSLYDQETALAFRKEILERGGTVTPAILYRRFRGADPDPAHLLKKRGLDRPSGSAPAPIAPSE